MCQQIWGHSAHNFAVAQSFNAVLIAIENRVRLSEAYWSVYGINPPSAELEAGGRVEKHSNAMPRICWHTILTYGNPQWYGKPLKQRRLLSRQGGHSSRYWCQQDVFLLSKRVPHPGLQGLIDPRHQRGDVGVMVAAARQQQ